MRRIDVLFVAFGVFIGCTTYDVVTPAEDSGGVDATTVDASSGTAAADGGFDVTVPDSPPPIDATGEKPPIDAAGCTCDCDMDGYRPVVGVATCSNAPGDCDDLDPRAFPDSGFRTDQPTADTNGDWNCDTHVTRQFNVNINCADFVQPLTGTCTTIEGFQTDPPCGESAIYVTCANNGFNAPCKQGTTVMLTQGCK
jgi:hypothetical protein